MGLYLEHMYSIRGLSPIMVGTIVDMNLQSIMVGTIVDTNLQFEEADTSTWVKFTMVVVEAPFLCQSANKNLAGTVSNLIVVAKCYLYRTDHLGLT